MNSGKIGNIIFLNLTKKKNTYEQACGLTLSLFA
jgi:hypothetical protein